MMASEIDRVHVDLTARPDVAKVYPSIYNSQKSGFDVNFKVDPAKANGTLKVIMRFAGDDANKNFEVTNIVKTTQQMLVILIIFT